MAPISVDELRALAWSDVTTPIPKEQLLPAFMTPPFIYVPGTFNTRDIGLVPGNPRVRPGYVFRTGALSSILDEGKKLLTDELGIKKIFDLRSIEEHALVADPEIPGVESVWVRPKEQRAVVKLEPFIEGGGEKGYAMMYMSVLDEYADNIKQVLEHVRDRPDEPFLFHCTAGRDRTGVVSGLLMSLAGGDAKAIILDFMLSRVGTEPAREQLLAFALRGSGAASIEAPGFHNMCSLRPSGWEAFVRAAEEGYAGFEGYVTKTLGFSDEDLATIKNNLSVAN